jgi:heme-degrading monooxygenase HmoA
MLVTVFRSRLNVGVQHEYGEWAARMSALVKAIPGYVSHKGFAAEDGERVTIVEFATAEGMRLWATHPEHVEAKRKGRNSFFQEYRVQIC